MRHLDKQAQANAAAVLVQRAKAGDRDAFGELVRRYRSRIFALALHLTRDENDADDITQEVFLGAFRALPCFAGRSEFFTWVYRMTVNRSISERRRRSRRTETAMDDPRVEKAVAVDAGGDPLKAAELRRTYAQLLAALDELPAEMRTSVVLVTLQGLSHEEAAIVQGCSSGTIAWRIHAARKHLRQALASEESNAPQPRSQIPERRPLSTELWQLLTDCNIPILAPSS